MKRNAIYRRIYKKNIWYRNITPEYRSVYAG
jgi:hypothetical protein